MADTLPKNIPASLLMEITDNLSDDRKLGKGAFGTVYKGIFRDGSMIAVKKLDENCDVPPEKQFVNEVLNLMEIQHENIVKLVGFCQELQTNLVRHNGRYIVVKVVEAFFCYEYLPRGSLDKYLFGSHRIDWDTRFNIIKGICKGLHFIHAAHVVHMDIKPDNILLDDNMAPKIADFGLSGIFGKEQTQMNTQNVAGALVYLAPEYVYRGEISTQADIYSLGLTIIQISTLDKITPNNDDKCGTKFIEQVRQKWTPHQRKSTYATIDERRFQQVQLCIQIGLECVEVDSNQRPSIVDIIDRLNGKRRGKISSEMSTSTSSDKGSDFLSTLENKNIPASFLMKITDNFSDHRKLGEGTFGTVYQGILPDGNMIAVKKLHEKLQVPQFDNEVSNLMAIQHENIVKLVGYCYESQKKMVLHNGRRTIVNVFEAFLCYEYLPRGSLDKYLFGPYRLDWDTRFNMVKGICNGVHFLHKGMDTPVVQMDIKPDNILLDDNMVPKISECGLSRIFGPEQTRMYTQNVVGALGYLAPEYHFRGQISTQSDIYSLGLTIIQISTLDKITPNNVDKCGTEFIEQVRQKWTSHQIKSTYATIDERRLQQVQLCIQIGLESVEVDSKKRPSIVDIIDRLNGKR